MVKRYDCVDSISFEGPDILGNDANATNSSPQPECALQVFTELALLMANVKERGPAGIMMATFSIII